MQRLTDEARAAIATGWLSTSLSQSDYAKQVGVSGRAVRLYVARFLGPRADRQADHGHDLLADAQKVQAEVARLGERLDKLQDAVDRVLGLLAALEEDSAKRHAAAQVTGPVVEAADWPLDCAMRKGGFGTGMPAGASPAPAKAGSAPKGEESTNGDVDGVEQEENQPATAPEEPASATAGTGGAAEVLNLPHLPMPFPRGWNVPGYFHQF